MDSKANIPEDVARRLAIISRARGQADRILRALERQDSHDEKIGLLNLSELVSEFRSCSASSALSDGPTTVVRLVGGLTPGELAHALAFTGVQVDVADDGSVALSRPAGVYRYEWDRKTGLPRVVTR